MCNSKIYELKHTMCFTFSNEKNKKNIGHTDTFKNTTIRLLKAERAGIKAIPSHFLTSTSCYAA